MPRILPCKYGLPIKVKIQVDNIVILRIYLSFLVNYVNSYVIELNISIGSSLTNLIIIISNIWKYEGERYDVDTNPHKVNGFALIPPSQKRIIISTTTTSINFYLRDYPIIIDMTLPA